MKTFQLSHVGLAKVEPGSLILLGADGADGADREHYFAMAVHQAGSPFAVCLVSFSADRSALRAVRTELSTPQTPDRFVLSLGQDFVLEPNLFEQVRTDVQDATALRAGDLLVQDDRQFLVVMPAKDKPALVVDLAGAEVAQLSARSVAVFTHWHIFVRGADGERICLVDTKSHRQAAAP